MIDLPPSCRARNQLNGLSDGVVYGLSISSVQNRRLISSNDTDRRWIGCRAAIARVSPSPRNGISHGGTCSTASRTGSTGRPASSTSVCRPRCVRSFAAQPPVIPDPTTIASNVRRSAGIRGVAIVPPGHRPIPELPCLRGFGRVVSPDCQVLEHPEPMPVSGFAIELFDDGRLLRRCPLEK